MCDRFLRVGALGFYVPTDERPWKRLNDHSPLRTQSVLACSPLALAATVIGTAGNPKTCAGLDLRQLVNAGLRC